MKKVNFSAIPILSTSSLLSVYVCQYKLTGIHVDKTAAFTKFNRIETIE